MGLLSGVQAQLSAQRSSPHPLVRPLKVGRMISDHLGVVICLIWLQHASTPQHIVDPTHSARPEQLQHQLIVGIVVAVV